ncbi:metallophosphoesterase [Pelosinus fermentans]|uniref:Metallophosphoesterase n=1 Tax=Pelosinus fermentans JBW45 TaxID=1192197 RepID=I8TP30_9FIRM|nr:metallophosphoesterase [Pelosinus fermentans]AJQ28922.1 metallophosphoesterase [Pelosinus fermentans JBW45]
MNSYILILSVLLLIYAAGNYYIGLRFFQSFRSIVEPYTVLYWSGYTFLAISKLVGRIGRIKFPGFANDIVIIIGDYWLAAAYYFFLFWIIIDVGSFLSDVLFHRQIIQGLALGLTVITLVGFLLAYGRWNACNPRVRQYDVVIPKGVSNLSSIHAVMVSDVHLGTIVDNTRLEEMVNKINELNPDIVFLVGDTIDEDVQRFIKKKMSEGLKKLNSQYGVFAVLGNHEYLGSDSQSAIEQLRQSGISVLRDEYQLVNNQFYIVGRDDPTSVKATGQQRLDLSAVMQGIDTKLPIILLDHQPFKLTEGQLNGVDLQLSGHTHHGQFFPNQYITKRIFEIDWGYLKKDRYQVIVSCGFGTWGPPIRIGNCPEIIDLMIHFEKEA